MIKGKDYGKFSCLSSSGAPKSRWGTDSEAIANAKYINGKYPCEYSKLVPYKCSHCFHYHLTTVEIKKKRY